MINAGDIISPFKEVELQKQFSANVRGTGTFPDLTTWKQQRHIFLQWNNPSLIYVNGWYPDSEKWIKIGECPIMKQLREMQDGKKV